MICPLGPVGHPCLGLGKDQECTVFTIEAILHRTCMGKCNYKNIHAPAVGIYAIKGAKKKKNPLKASKAKDKE